MVHFGRHAVVCSHVSSAFAQPTFYSIPPKSQQPQAQSSTHASQKLLSKLSNKSKSPNTSSPHPTALGQSLEEHAVYASITSLPHLGDALLRVTHSAYVLELTLLDWLDGAPASWEFKEQIVPMPYITVPNGSSGSQMIQRGMSSRAAPDGQLAYIYVLLHGGTLYRLSFPLISPFFHDDSWNARRTWCKEFTVPSSVSRPIGGTGNGTVILQGEKVLWVTVNSGAVMRLEVDVENDGALKEKIFYPQHHSLLAKVFRSTNPEEDGIISIAAAPKAPGSSSGVDFAFTISRDRSLRIWDKNGGNLATVSLPSSPGTSAQPSGNAPSRATSVLRGSSMPPPSSTVNPGTAAPVPSLPAERRTLIRAFYANSSNELRVLVFMPTPPGTRINPDNASGGFFILYKLAGSGLVKLGEKEASERTGRCALRDFMVKASETGDHEVHCLWERSGETMYEFSELGIEPFTSRTNGAHQRRRISNHSDAQMRDSDSPSTSDSEADSDSDGLSLTPTWHLIPTLSQSSLSAAGTPLADHVDFLSTIDFSSPGATHAVLNALFRPAAGGGFSPYTIAEALRGYVEAAWVPPQKPEDSKAQKGQDTKDQKRKKLAAPVAPLKDPNTALRTALSKQYPTLRARVGAIVGCRLKDLDLRPGRMGPAGEDTANVFGATTLGMEDSMHVGEQQREYYATLRRDWEGFLARCREIEKAGRWPVALGFVGGKHTSEYSNATQDRTRRDSGECVVVERERMGMLVGEDQPLAVHRRVLAEMELEPEDREGGLQIHENRFTGISRRRSKHNAPRQLIRLALSLKSFFSASTWAEVTHELYTTVRNSVSMLYQDLLLDLARRVAMEDVDQDTVAWVFEQIGAAFEDDEAQFQEAIDAVSRVIRSTGDAQQIEAVKVEDDEEEVGRMLLHSTASASQLLQTMNGLETTGDNHNQWTKSLTAAYLSATLEARYEIASGIIFLLMLLKSRGHEWVEQTSAQHLDELFAGLRSNSILRQTASRVMEGEREGPSGAAGDDPNASLMDIDGMSRPNPLALVPTHARAGTVDSMAGRMAGMRVGAYERPHVHFAAVPGLGIAGSEAGEPSLPPTTRGFGSVPLLQSLLLPLKRTFKLPYASDAFLFSNGIIENDTLAIASVPEVQFAEELRRRGNYNASADVIDWLPKGNACCYVAGRLRIQRGDYDEAADLFDRSARSFGYLSFRSKMEELGLVAVLPKELAKLDSLPDYYQHIAELFENEYKYRYSVPFYKLAIESTGEDISTRDLWYNVFRGQLAIEEYEQAYISVGLMNDAALRDKSVPELVTAMCEANKVELLMSFNFVEYFKHVQKALGFKARNADPLERPLYSHILHRWHIQRGNYRAASIVMYQRARSLGDWDRFDSDERYMLLEQQLEAYALAISALGLLDAGDAWISLPLDDDERKPSGMFEGEDEDGERLGNLEIVELSDMRREFELCKARRALVIIAAGIQGYFEKADFEMSHMEVLVRYSEHGHFEEALFSARVFQMDMTVIFSAFVEHCITISKMGMGAIPEHAKGWLQSETIAAWEGNSVQKGWKLLQECLERHDSASTGWLYRKICLERIMDADRSSAPPTWLTTFFQDREPEYLIRTCLRYHLIGAALDYTMFMIQKANQPFDQGAVVAVTQTHLPYALIDSVVAAATSKEERRKASVIKAEIKARIGRVGKWEWN